MSGARFTVYLPEDVRERGRQLGLNMSGLLRMQVIQAVHERAGDTEGAQRAAAVARALRTAPALPPMFAGAGRSGDASAPPGAV